MLEIKEADLELIARITLRSLLKRKPDRVLNWRWFLGPMANWWQFFKKDSNGP